MLGSSTQVDAHKRAGEDRRSACVFLSLAYLPGRSFTQANGVRSPLENVRVPRPLFLFEFRVLSSRYNHSPSTAMPAKNPVYKVHANCIVVATHTQPREGHRATAATSATR